MRGRSRRSCPPAFVAPDHDCDLEGYPIDQRRIIDLDPPNVSKIEKPFLAARIRGIQCWNFSNVRNYSLHRAAGRASSDAHISRGVSTNLKKARDGIRREIPLGMKHRPYRTGPLFARFLAINCQATIVQSLRDKITNHDFSFLAVARSNDVRIRLMAWSMSASDLRKKLIQPLSGKI